MKGLIGGMSVKRVLTNERELFTNSDYVLDNVPEIRSQEQT